MDKNKARLYVLKIIGILNLISGSLGVIILLYFVFNLYSLNFLLTIFYLFLIMTLVAQIIFIFGFLKFKEWGRRGLIYVFNFEIGLALLLVFLRFSFWKNTMTNIELVRTVKWIPILGWMIYYLTRDYVKALFKKTNY